MALLRAFIFKTEKKNICDVCGINQWLLQGRKFKGSAWNMVLMHLLLFQPKPIVL